jgi:hypothetical protein
MWYSYNIYAIYICILSGIFYIVENYLHICYCIYYDSVICSCYFSVTLNVIWSKWVRVIDKMSTVVSVTDLQTQWLLMKFCWVVTLCELLGRYQCFTAVRTPNLTIIINIIWANWTKRYSHYNHQMPMCTHHCPADTQDCNQHMPNQHALGLQS